ncbi:hypothetical protein A3860_23710 [Niastella vici]|uniref:Thoeris protein ThsB TIR-like domain-containing protein n=1 Tax=Niastella vici TaxID=1703345 RepID=A0A1V9FYB7_9BACT|nr:TIR domain-containing protein [Niastella vici]OQP63359.1 hypothetical protein A3860_23710 [Niastella vici]
MTRKVFFSFHYKRDIVRVSRIRNSGIVTSNYEKSSFLDHADWESIQRKGSSAIKDWIDSQLIGSTVTCVLIGSETNDREWVHYEIEQSVLRKNAVLGVYVHNMKDFNGNVDRPGFNPLAKHKINGYDLQLIAPVYDWELHDGYRSFGGWIDQAVSKFKHIGHFRG